MKKLRCLLFFLAVVALVPMLFACSDKTDLNSTYSCETTENGVTVKYVLSLNEKDGTYSMRQNGASESTYSGTFTYDKGYYVLASPDGKTEYVKTIGNVFSFVTPDKDVPTPECEHDYAEITEVSGTCLSTGYKLFRCTKCNAEKKEETTKGAHSLKQTKREEGTCQKKGYIVSKCSTCGEEFTVYDEKFGAHKNSNESVSDNGCLKKRVARTYCTVCQQKTGEVTLDKYGSHNYAADGVCSICKFDKVGFYHGHTDDCSSACENHAALVAMQQNGYYLSSDEQTLYFGAYPSNQVTSLADAVINDGKFDVTTGYYRYEHASYCVTEKNGEKLVFSVSPIKWNKAETGGVSYYVCSSVIDRTAYLNAMSVLPINKKEGNGQFDKTTAFYYNKNYYDASKTTNISANDFDYSDIKSFANDDFLSKAFTESNKAKIEGRVIIPFDEATRAAVKSGVTDYAAVSAEDYGVYDKYSFFTSITEFGSGNEKTFCADNTVFSSDLSELNVVNYFGFVPVIRLK